MRNRRDFVSGVLLTIFGMGVVLESIRLKLGTILMPQPGLFPFLYGLCFICLAVVLSARAWLGLGNESQLQQEAFGNVRRPAILVISLVIYAAMMEPVGYVLPTALIAAIILRTLGVSSWKVIILASLGLSLGTYFLFGNLLGIDLPSGLLSFT